ncbi:MAG: helix-turn-helix domain-containing protein [Gammaproteobacteria bacterium]|nr:helix-turn-helix domain-containing protein [Gammaproteobacteria bacterium]
MQGKSPVVLDPVLHQPVRTRIAAFLMARGESTFSDLKKALAITDGNLDAHMKKLVAGHYVLARKESGHGRPQTYYTMSASGEERFRRYIQILQGVLQPIQSDRGD